MHTHTSRGFIPLVAIILLGLIAVTGGTIAAISIRHNTRADAPMATSTQLEASSTAYSAPVQARVQSSGAGTTHLAPDAPSMPVAQIVRLMDTATSQDCQEVQSDLRDVKVNGDGTGDLNHTQGTASLLKTVAELCNALKKPTPNTADGDAQFLAGENVVKQQFGLYKGTQTQESSQSPSPSQADNTYNTAQCTTQKQTYVAQADQMYLTWYSQWQDARKTVDACYSSNSVPVCDKQLSEINVDWQNKLTTQFDGLHGQLTSCAPDDRHFNDVSSVVAAPY